MRGGNDAGLEFAKSIMTTDTHPKQIAVQYESSDGSTVTVGGCAKGAGMIPSKHGDDAVFHFHGCGC